jgi:hypothetical protein
VYVGHLFLVLVLRALGFFVLSDTTPQLRVATHPRGVGTHLGARIALFPRKVQPTSPGDPTGLAMLQALGSNQSTGPNQKNSLLCSYPSIAWGMVVVCRRMGWGGRHGQEETGWAEWDGMGKWAWVD